MKRIFLIYGIALVAWCALVTTAYAVVITSQNTKTANGTASALSATAMECTMLVIVADDGATTNGNDGIIFVGNASVTTANGLPMRPGGSYNVPVNFESGTVDPSTIYVVATDSSEKLRWNCWN